MNKVYKRRPVHDGLVLYVIKKYFIFFKRALPYLVREGSVKWFLLLNMTVQESLIHQYLRLNQILEKQMIETSKLFELI